MNLKWIRMHRKPRESRILLYSITAKGAEVTRHTVAKWHEMIRKMFMPAA